MAYCCNEVVMQGQKSSSFSRVIFGIGRMIRVVQGVR